jgi:CspA family cold shock protein
MPTGRVKWFSLEKGFGFIASDEGEDVYLAAANLPAGVTTVKPGTKLEFGIAEGRRGAQALSVRVIDTPPTLSGSRQANDDLAIIIEESIKMLDRVGNGIRHGRFPSEAEAQRVAKVLRGIAQQIEG